jgi:deoxyribonuclease-4
VATLRPDELGAHMSIAGGLHLAIERGQALGCFAVQIFVKNQRQWAAPPLRDDDVRAFRAARRSSGVRSVFAHASYLINLASPDQGTPFIDHHRGISALLLSAWCGRRL